jgi:hypothetical protein
MRNNTMSKTAVKPKLIIGCYGEGKCFGTGVVLDGKYLFGVKRVEFEAPPLSEGSPLLKLEIDVENFKIQEIPNYMKWPTKADDQSES